MAKRGICAACGKPFTLCRFNEHHQIYCTRPKCVRKRKQERQRKSHNKRYREDPEYQAAKRKKSKDYMRERRRKEKASAEEKLSYDPMDILTGVVSQLTSEDDPEVVRERLRSYSARGRQLSHFGSLSGQSP